MIRAVVAVALAVALVGVSLPAIQSAGIDHSNQRIASELERVESAARTLAARSSAAPRGVTARRTLRLRLPERTWAQAGTERLSVPPPTGSRRVSWRVTGGQRRHRRLLGGSLVGPPGGLTIREGGTHRIALLLQADGTVVVRRLKFINRSATTAAHGDTESLAPGWRGRRVGM